MTRTLVRKELAQHWPAMLLIGLLTLVGYGLVLAVGLIRGEAGSVFEGLRMFVLVMMALATVVLCHRLVVVEYQARTQLFLEALPVSRARMVAVKYALGLVVWASLLAVALALACALAHRREALTPRFVGLLAARAFAATWCAYNFFFLMGFLGRYRVAVYLGVLVACMAIDQLTNVHFDRFGPLALLDERFAFERERVPTEALRTTLALGGAFSLLAFALGLVREGSVAALLAERMSHREKICIAALLVGFLFVIVVLEERKPKQPFDLHGAITELRPGLVLKATPGPVSGTRSISRVTRSVADELAAARAYLGLTALPPVFLTHRRDLDADRYERGELTAAEGLSVQANFTAREWSEADFTAWLLREALIVRSHGRAKLEPKMWVLDGFGWFWLGRERAADPLANDRSLALRAAYGTEAGFAPGDLRRWLSFRERVGGDVAAGVAWSGLRTIARRQGPERCQRFLRAVLAGELPQDARAWLRERANPLERLLREEAGWSSAEFFAAWQADLAEARRALADDLARVPRLRGEVEFVPLSADSRRVRYRVTIDPAPGGDFSYSFVYHFLPPLDEEVKPSDLRREHQRYALTREAELPENVSRGARLFSAFALKVPALGCEVVSGWTRREIP